MTSITEWQIKTTLLQHYAPESSPHRVEAIERVMEIIRRRFIPKETVEQTLEKLRIPDTDAEVACPLERSACAYNKALDSVKVSLINDG